MYWHGRFGKTFDLVAIDIVAFISVTCSALAQAGVQNAEKCCDTDIGVKSGPDADVNAAAPHRVD